MTHSKTQRDQARRLWAGSWSGVIGTHAADHPGYPFGSVVPFVLGEDGQPLLLLSPLSQHTRNIERDRRCSLTIAEAGTGDVQQLARLTAIGEVRRLDALATRHDIFDISRRDERTGATLASISTDSASIVCTGTGGLPPRGGSVARG